MLGLKNSEWIDLIETYKELPLLWDPKHEDYSNNSLRQKAYEKVFKKYELIDGKASMLQFLLHFKKNFSNMRTTYHRERKKVELSKQDGKNYIPTLWYYKHLGFLDKTLDRSQKKYSSTYFNRYNNKIYLENRPVRKKKNKYLNTSKTLNQVQLKVKSGFINIEPFQSSEDEDNSENIQTSKQQPQNRLIDLLQKQESFVATVTELLSKKEHWQLVGKAIALQLCKLEEKQRIIAHKLINDAIYFGTLDKLTVTSFVHLSERESPVYVKEDVYCDLE